MASWQEDKFDGIPGGTFERRACSHSAWPSVSLGMKATGTEPPPPRARESTVPLPQDLPRRWKDVDTSDDEAWVPSLERHLEDIL